MLKTIIMFYKNYCFAITGFLLLLIFIISVSTKIPIPRILQFATILFGPFLIIIGVLFRKDYSLLLKTKGKMEALKYFFWVWVMYTVIGLLILIQLLLNDIIHGNIFLFIELVVLMVVGYIIFIVLFCRARQSEKL